MELRIKKLLQDGPKTFSQLLLALYPKATGSQKKSLKKWLQYLETDASIECINGEYQLVKYDYDRKKYRNELNKDTNHENN